MLASALVSPNPAGDGLLIVHNKHTGFYQLGKDFCLATLTACGGWGSRECCGRLGSLWVIVGQVFGLLSRKQWSIILEGLA